MDTNYSIRYVSDEGWRKTPNQKAPSTGTPLIEKSLFDIFELCKCLPDDGKKGEHGAIFTYDKGTVGNASVGYYDSLMTGGVIFVDIDHIPSTLVDDIFDKFDDINFECNSAIMGCQKSSSYYRRPGTDDTGVHFFLASRPCNGHDYVKFSSYSLAFVALAIKKALGVDVRKYDRRKENTGNVDKVLDTSSCKISQRSFLYYSDYRYNEVVIPITDEAYNLNSSILKKEYPELFKFEHYSTQDLTPVDLTGVNVTAGENLGKIQLDYSKECIISNFLSATGMEPDKVLIIMLEIDSRDRREYLYKHKQTLENHLRQIIRTSKTQKISAAGKKMAEEMLESCGVTVAGGYKNKESDSKISKYTLSDTEWMSEKVDDIMGEFENENVISIQAPTGAGKSFMTKKLCCKLLLDGYQPIILMPFNAMLGIYNWTNVVSSTTDNTLKKNEISEVGQLGMDLFEDGVEEEFDVRVNSLIWDQFIKHYKEIEENFDTVIVDESHCLFLDRRWRDVAIKVMDKLNTEWLESGKKIIFISATPTGETRRFNAKQLQFSKKDKRYITTQIINTDNALTYYSQCLNEVGYDRVAVFSDLDVSLLKSYRIDCDIFHSRWERSVGILRKNRDVVMTSKNNLFTSIAVNGINLVNPDKNVLLLIRYIRGETTIQYILQALGRFRNAERIDIKLVIQYKGVPEELTKEEWEDLVLYAKQLTKDEVFSIRTPYLEKLSDDEYYDAEKSIRKFEEDNSTIKVVCGVLYGLSKEFYRKERIDYSDDPQKITRRNQIKAKQSALMRGFVKGGIQFKDMYDEIKDKKDEENDFVTGLGGWMHTYNKLKDEPVFGYMLENWANNKKSNFDTLVNDYYLIKKVISYNDEEWKDELKKRDEFEHNPDNSKFLKGRTHEIFKDRCHKVDTVREGWYKFLMEIKKSETQNTNIEDCELLFVSGYDDEIVNNTKQLKLKPHKGGWKSQYKNVETQELKLRGEWIEVLKCNKDQFNYLIKRGLYQKV